MKRKRLILDFFSLCFFVFLIVEIFMAHSTYSADTKKPRMKMKGLKIKKQFIPTISKNDLSLSAILIQPPLKIGERIGWGSAGDLNGDKKSEILIDTGEHSAPTEYEIPLQHLHAFGWSGGGYTLHWTKSSKEMGLNAFLRHVAGDIDGDKKQEFVVSTDKGPCIFKNNGIFHCINQNEFPLVIAAGDVDNDGVDEIIASEDNLSLMQFSVHIYKSSNNQFQEIFKTEGADVSIGDFDNDGKNDLAIQHVNVLVDEEMFCKYKGKKEGFKILSSVKKSRVPSNLVFGKKYVVRVTKKGKKEIVAAGSVTPPKENKGSVSKTFLALLSLEGGKFRLKTTGPQWSTSVSSPGFELDTLNVLDIDGDGKDEIVVALWNYQNETGYIKVFGFKGNSFYERWSLKEKDISYRILAVGDTDGDGTDEVILKRNTNSLLILKAERI